MYEHEIDITVVNLNIVIRLQFDTIEKPFACTFVIMYSAILLFLL